MRAIHNPPIHYRPDIDGLRAIAVLPVILFHAGFEFFSGGYVGVDVFFVISGYLITSIILKEVEQGKFSIVNFYERRARRILPALFFVLMCCLPVAWILLFPEELERLGQSLLAVTLFSSNFYFWRATDYFAPASEEYPLLHTWSLAVEEQYYLLFPLFLLLFWRFGRKTLFTATVLVACVSLALADWAWKNAPVANFYLLPTRAWELLIGSCIAFWHSSPLAERYRPSQYGRNLLAAVGLGLICLAIVSFDDTASVPGLAALVPTLGAGLVIAFGGTGGYAGKLLSTRPLVLIGLISYSAYLWHQPLFAFARIYEVGEPSIVIAWCLACLSLVLAYVTWRYVETPLRSKQKFPRAMVFRSAGVAMAVFICVGSVIQMSRGDLGRFQPNIVTLAKSLRSPMDGCEMSPSSDLAKFSPCVLGDINADPTFALWGDSHAGALAPAVDEYSKSKEASGWLLSYTGCPSLPRIKRLDLGVANECSKFNRLALDKLLESHQIHTVVLFSRWVINVEGERYVNGLGGMESGARAVLVSEENPEPLDESQRDRLIELRLRETLSALLDAGKRVVLIYPTPEFGWDVPSYARRAARLSMSGAFVLSPPRLPLPLAEKRLHRARMVLDAATQGLAVEKIDPVPLFCSDGYCQSGERNVLWYFDDDHLSTDGGRLLVNKTPLHSSLGT